MAIHGTSLHGKNEPIMRSAPDGQPDDLIAALNGDQAAALRLRQRQQARLEQMRTACKRPDHQPPPTAAPPLPTPRSARGKVINDRILVDALSGTGVWISDASCDLFLAPAAPPPPARETDTLAGALNALHQKAELEEQLKAKLAERDRLLLELQEKTGQQRTEADALAARARAYRPGWQSKVETAANRMGLLREIEPWFSLSGRSPDKTI